MLTLAKTQPWMFSHITGTAVPTGPFNPRVGLVGHSWGGMAAAIAGRVRAPRSARKAILKWESL